MTWYLRDMTQSYVWYYLIVCVTCLNHMRDMTQSNVWYCSTVCATCTCNNHMCDTTTYCNTHTWRAAQKTSTCLWFNHVTQMIEPVTRLIVTCFSHTLVTKISHTHLSRTFLFDNNQTWHVTITCVTRSIICVTWLNHKQVDVFLAARQVCVLQYVVVCCSALQCVAVRCRVLQGVAVWCSVLLSVAVCCSLLQSVAACCKTHMRCTCAMTRTCLSQTPGNCLIDKCNTLQHTATRCNTLQHTATAHLTPGNCLIDKWNTPQNTATHCNTLKHTAAHCSTLQHTAVHCNTL